MLLDLDVTGRRVVVIGTADGAAAAVTRLARNGARVTLAAIDVVPFVRLDGVRYVGAPAVADTSGWLRLLGPAWMLVPLDPDVALRDRLCELAGHLKVLVTGPGHDAAGTDHADGDRQLAPLDQAPGA